VGCHLLVHVLVIHPLDARIYRWKRELAWKNPAPEKPVVCTPFVTWSWLPLPPALAFHCRVFYSFVLKASIVSSFLNCPNIWLQSQRHKSTGIWSVQMMNHTRHNWRTRVHYNMSSWMANRQSDFFFDKRRIILNNSWIYESVTSSLNYTYI